MVAALLGLLYDPVRLAEELAVLDHVSSGRVLCVLGMGYRSEEYRMFGVEEDSRGQQMEDLLAMLKEAWAEQSFDHPSRGRVRVTPAPATPGGPPLAYGGHSNAAARRAARHGLMLVAEAGDDELRQAYEEEAQRVGIEAPGCMLAPRGTATTAFVSDDPDAAWAELGPRLLTEIRSYREWNRGPASRISPRCPMPIPWTISGPNRGATGSTPRVRRPSWRHRVRSSPSSPCAAGCRRSGPGTTCRMPPMRS